MKTRQSAKKWRSGAVLQRATAARQLAIQNKKAAPYAGAAFDPLNYEQLCERVNLANHWLC